MNRYEYVVAINTDKNAPMGEIADVLVVADLKEFVSVITEKARRSKSLRLLHVSNDIGYTETIVEALSKV